MQGTIEPLANPWFVAFMIFSISKISPLTPACRPPLESDGTFAHPPTVINGLPWWAMKMILLAIIPTVALMLVVWVFPLFDCDPESLRNQDVDLDIVPMIQTEIYYRRCFDERNKPLHRRKKHIRRAAEEWRTTVDSGGTEDEGQLGLSSAHSQRLLQFDSRIRLARVLRFIKRVQGAKKNSIRHKASTVIIIKFILLLTDCLRVYACVLSCLLFWFREELVQTEQQR